MAVLAEGVQGLGHTPMVIAAGPTGQGDEEPFQVLRLRSLSLPYPLTGEALRARLAGHPEVVDEVCGLLSQQGADLVCWSDFLWGLGVFMPAPARVATALLIHHVPPVAKDPRWRQVLERVGTVCATDPSMVRHGAKAGWNTDKWWTLPTAVPGRRAVVVSAQERERLRQTGPIRVICAQPSARLITLMRDLARGGERRVEVVSLTPDIEAPSNKQANVMAACRGLAQRRPGRFQVIRPLRWPEVDAFLAQAAVAVIVTNDSEGCCPLTASAWHAGTPAITLHPDGTVVMAGAPPASPSPSAGVGTVWSLLEDLLGGIHVYTSAVPVIPGACVLGAGRLLRPYHRSSLSDPSTQLPFLVRNTP
ncbi:hypothetical protein [Streptosporangium sp. CA-115845]|uniref:hypothetical protein n=1 Tax=Streptosporangium sp. CA-115845 TaxID=3240071 RepID=UPI003D92FCCF